MKHLYAVVFSGMLSIMTAACGGGTSTGNQVLSPEEYARAMAGDTTAVLIDVRTPEEYAQGHLAGARLMDVSEEEAFVKGVDSLDARHTYYIYCRSGRRSRKAAGIMQERGLTVVDMEGGYLAWQERDSMAASAVGGGQAE